MINEQTKEKILQVANYILENKATINMVYEKFGYSISTIKKYINDEDKLQSIDNELYEKVKEVQKEIEHEGQIKGAKIGKRKPTYTDEEIIEILNEMVKKGLTLEEAYEIYGVSTSTLYERIMTLDEEYKSSAKKLFEENKESAFNNKKTDTKDVEKWIY